MKRLSLFVALLLTFSISLISCRETKNEDINVELNDAGNELEDAVDDTGDAIEEGVNEVDDEF